MVTILIYLLTAFSAGVFVYALVIGVIERAKQPETVYYAQGDYTEPSPSPDPYAQQRLNINTADAKQLATLPGIGDKTALAIITYRSQFGGFRYVEDLMNIPGIGEKKLEALLTLITVGEDSEPTPTGRIIPLYD